MKGCPESKPAVLSQEASNQCGIYEFSYVYLLTYTWRSSFLSFLLIYTIYMLLLALCSGHPDILSSINFEHQFSLAGRLQLAVLRMGQHHDTGHEAAGRLPLPADEVPRHQEHQLRRQDHQHPAHPSCGRLLGPLSDLGWRRMALQGEAHDRVTVAPCKTQLLPL